MAFEAGGMLLPDDGGFSGWDESKQKRNRRPSVPLPPSVTAVSPSV